MRAGDFTTADRPLRRSQVPTDWLRAAFLTLAWFWLLSPTQNPWYWIWALPLVMFTRNRAWLAMSGLVMIYYLRFWFIHHWADRVFQEIRQYHYGPDTDDQTLVVAEIR